jgi:hypothetical protein
VGGNVVVPLGCNSVRVPEHVVLVHLAEHEHPRDSQQPSPGDSPGRGTRNSRSFHTVPCRDTQYPSHSSAAQDARERCARLQVEQLAARGSPSRGERKWWTIRTVAQWQPALWQATAVVLPLWRARGQQSPDSAPGAARLESPGAFRGQANVVFAPRTRLRPSPLESFTHQPVGGRVHTLAGSPNGQCHYRTGVSFSRVSTPRKPTPGDATLHLATQTREPPPPCRRTAAARRATTRASGKAATSRSCAKPASGITPTCAW